MPKRPKYNNYNPPPIEVCIQAMDRQIQKVLKGDNSDRTPLFDNIDYVYQRFYHKCGDRDMSVNFYIEVIIPKLLILVEKRDITKHTAAYRGISFYLKEIKERFITENSVISMLSPRMLSLMETL